ncbi:MAG: GyrI-like domain-containing protein [Anaerolineales bacterium]|nr:MAG: GyrI-like domain-containing protein [Anaerolineales bacterium]
MKKLDLKKEYKHLYNPSAKQVSLVSVPRFNFIMIDGQIPPNIKVDDAPDYQNAVEALYSLSYTIKFICKKRKTDPVDYAVMPLEGLWWSKSSNKEFTPSRKDTWYFTAMIMQPAPVTKAIFAEGVEAVRAKKNPAMLDAARFEAFAEGKAVQVMHLGPYADEPATIARMVAFSEEHGLKPNGKHHEIYLGDPRRTAPAKLKTVLRHPVK